MASRHPPRSTRQRTSPDSGDTSGGRDLKRRNCRSSLGGRREAATERRPAAFGRGRVPAFAGTDLGDCETRLSDARAPSPVGPGTDSSYVASWWPCGLPHASTSSAEVWLPPPCCCAESTDLSARWGGCWAGQAGRRNDAGRTEPSRTQQPLGRQAATLKRTHNHVWSQAVLSKFGPGVHPAGLVRRAGISGDSAVGDRSGHLRPGRPVAGRQSVSSTRSVRVAIPPGEHPRLGVVAFEMDFDLVWTGDPRVHREALVGRGRQEADGSRRPVVADGHRSAPASDRGARRRSPRCRWRRGKGRDRGRRRWTWQRGGRGRLRGAGHSRGGGRGGRIPRCGHRGRRAARDGRR